MLGGISTGQDVLVSIAIKPTSSIRLARKTIDIDGNAATIETHGRHDPCVGIRATPIAEAFLALVLVDHAMRQCGQNGDAIVGMDVLKRAHVVGASDRNLRTRILARHGMVTASMTQAIRVF